MQIKAKYMVVAYQQGKKEPTLVKESKCFRHTRDAQEYAASLQQASDESGSGSGKAQKNGAWVIVNMETILD